MPRRSGAGLPSAKLVAKHDGFRNLLFRLPPLAALALDRQIRFLFSDRQIALQDALGAVEDLARLEALGELRVLLLEPRHLDLGADEETDHRNQLRVLAAVLLRLA